MGVVNLDRDNSLASIQKETGAPAWLCALCWDHCAGEADRTRALVWGVRFLVERGWEEISRVRAERMISSWLAASADGYQKAQSDVREGKVLELSFGLIRGGLATCPRCLIRWESNSGVDPRSAPTPSCPQCGTSLIRLVSLGCLVNESSDGRVEGYNRAVEYHLRATQNPEFSWKKVKSLTM